MIMAIVLEATKIVTAYWCHMNWSILPKSIKTYLVSSVIVLMGITSLGIYGFLAKSHIVQKQEIATQYGTKTQLYDAQIAAKKEQIKTVDQQIAVIDSVIDQAAKKGWVTKSLQLNRQYAKDKQELIDQKVRYQVEILALEEKKIATGSQRELSESSKVGPLKYVINLIYGDADAQQLNTAVRWLIIILVAVFDPLAIALLISTGYVFSKISNPIQRPPVSLKRPVAIVSTTPKKAADGN